MTADQTRAEAVRLIKSREKCNTYTQGGNRTYVFGKPAGTKKGYGDCSSTVRACILKASGVDIGSNTSAQISKRSMGIVVEDNRDGKLSAPTKSKLKPGDAVYYKGTPSHTWGVGHVEMVTGTNECYGHGSGIGPTKKNLTSYSKSRTGSKKYLCTIRWIKDTTKVYSLGDRPLSIGCVGDDVKDLQQQMVRLGFNLDIDGEYGENTSAAVKSFQSDRGLTKTGTADLSTISIILSIGSGTSVAAPIQRVKIYGGDCYIRVLPDPESESVGAAKDGSVFESSGEYDENDNWIGVIYKGKGRWVSGKYAEIIGKEEETSPDDAQIEDPNVEDDDLDISDDPTDIELTVPEELKHSQVVVTANRVNVRKKPKSGAKILKVVKKGAMYNYTGEVVNGWYGVINNGTLGWISSKVSKLTNAMAKPTEKKIVCIDLSQHNNLKSSKNDWALLARNVSFVVLRCGVRRTNSNPIGIGKDDHFDYAAQQCIKHGIPFGVYYYGKSKTIADSQKEADKCFDIANKYNPLFYAYDVEEGILTTDGISAWMDRIRAKGIKKVGIYTIGTYYRKHKAAMKKADFMWGARFCGGKNKKGKWVQSGVVNDNQKPDFPCDLWQFTSIGSAPGISDQTIDVNTLMGTKPLSYFLEQK